MGFWNWLAGGGKAVETTADTINTVTKGAVSGLDAIFYTDQEEAEHALKRMDAQIKMADGLARHVESTLEESTERSKARRWIAKNVFKLWAAMMLLTAVLMFIDENKAAKIVKVVKAFELGTAFLMVMAFYFTAYMINLGRKGWGKA